MTSVEYPTRSFALGLPDGFVELPSSVESATADSVGEVTAYFARLFNLPPDDQNAAAAAVYFAAVGTSSGDEGVDHTAMAMYRSPDDPERAMMVLLSSTCLSAGHADVDSAIAGLLEIHRAVGRGTVTRVELPAGPAVVVVDEEQNGITIGEQFAPIVHRKITAWVPDPDGSTVAVVSMASNNWPDWAHVCRLALNIFDTLDWDR
ncbi:MAG TPA: hypothetical protein VGD84_16270 [Pseudonocardiaceae bacterium]